MEKTQLQADIGAADGRLPKEAEQGPSSTQASLTGPPSLLPSEEAAQKAVGEGTVDDVKMKDEGDDHEYSPPAAVPPEAVPSQDHLFVGKEDALSSSNDPNRVVAQVSQVLAHLSHMQGKG
jgi:hypothetical protein